MEERIQKFEREIDTDSTKAEQMSQYFTQSRISAIENASSFEDLSKLALEILTEMAQKAKRSIPRKELAMILGPMKTGGKGSFDANIKRYDFAVQEIERENLTLIFNQAHKVFQAAIEKIFDDKKNFPNGYEATTLINGYNKPLLESGLIDKIYLLPNRTDSLGTKLEFEIVLKEQIPTEEITEEWLKTRGEI